MHSESGGWVRRRRLRGGGMDVESPAELADQAGHREGATAENPPSGTAQDPPETAEVTRLSDTFSNQSSAVIY